MRKGKHWDSWLCESTLVRKWKEKEWVFNGRRENTNRHGKQ